MNSNHCLSVLVLRFPEENGRVMLHMSAMFAFPHVPRVIIAAVAALVFGTNDQASAMPDLIPLAENAHPYVSSEDFTGTSCAVDEGCTSEGRRRLLRFETHTYNIGSSDLVMGNPVGNPFFTLHPCHGHYHFEDYLNVRLKTTTGSVVGATKQSFCLLDTIRHDPSASPTPLYNCSNQGIQAGWGDIYQAALDCQYVDITGLPAGEYILELHVNPEGILAESDESNNVSTTSVTIDELTPVPPNDLCTDAIDIQVVGVPVTGSTESAANDGQACGVSSAARDVWFRYIPVNSGPATFSLCTSGYNTVLSIHSGCPGTVSNMINCNDNSITGGCVGTDRSYLSLNVTAAMEYLIRVSGYNGLHGTYRLIVNGPGGNASAEAWNQFQ